MSRFWRSSGLVWRKWMKPFLMADEIHIVYVMFADDLTAQIIRASVMMTLTKYSRNISAWALDRQGLWNISFVIPCLLTRDWRSSVILRCQGWMNSRVRWSKTWETYLCIAQTFKWLKRVKNGFAMVARNSYTSRWHRIPGEPIDRRSLLRRYRSRRKWIKDLIDNEI